MIDTTRHITHFNADAFAEPVHIIGCGGMGSRIAEGLVRMGIGREASPLSLYDGDTFESHNVANQLARQRDISRHKVHAVREQLLQVNKEACIQTSAMMVTDNFPLRGVVFLCLDSMQERREVMEGLIVKQPDITCVIETRMDAEVGISHCFDPQHEKHMACWRQHWFSDDEADSMAGCSSPVSIISAIFGTSALALRQFEQYARIGTAWHVQHRLYQEFDTIKYSAETWT